MDNEAEKVFLVGPKSKNKHGWRFEKKESEEKLYCLVR